MNMKNRKFVTILVLIGLISVVIFTTGPVSACYYEVGTFQSDYTTTKNSFYKGEFVYGKGSAYEYDYPLKLRITDSNGNIVCNSGDSNSVIRGSYFLDETAPVGTWSIQLGIYCDCEWEWSTDYGRIVYFTVTDANFILTVDVDGNGSVSVDPELNYYPLDSLVNLTANPNSGWSFSSWSGDISSSNNPESIIMNSDKSVTAHFIQNQYVLNVDIDGNGTVIKEPNQEFYVYGDIVFLTAVANNDSMFNYWSGDIESNNTTETIIIDSNKIVTAHFIISQEGGGSVKTTETSNKLPVADLSAGEPYIDFIGEEIDFNGSLSYDPNGKIVEYEWNFGDGTTSNGEITTHAYLLPGEYKVELKVTDNRGGIDTDETIAVIVVPNHPPSKPVVNGPTEGKVNTDYAFSVFSVDEDQDEIKYTINWGDGNINESDYILSGALFNASHKWLTSGQYSIIIKAYDGKTNTTEELTIIIQEPDKTVPESDNFILILLALLALILLLLFLLLALRKKDKDENMK